MGHLLFLTRFYACSNRLSLMPVADSAELITPSICSAVDPQCHVPLQALSVLRCLVLRAFPQLFLSLSSS